MFNRTIDILLSALDKPANSVHPTIHNLLSRAFPKQTLLETDNSFFRPWVQNEHWKIAAHKGKGFDTQFDIDWIPKVETIHNDIYSGWLRATWSKKEITLLCVGTTGGHCRNLRWYVLGDSKEIVEGFFAEVCKANSVVNSEILVFQEGQWHANAELFLSVQQTKIDDLILHGELKHDVENDLKMFLEQEETYRKYRIPWKRGVMFLGPPGNGKTHMIKALINRFSLPCLYVKSFDGHYISPQQGVALAFHRARQMSPCFLILEDLDTLLTEENRSFFLNEMDGFASNDGIVTIASCNFPEKLDAAIMDRPSRFDRKYHFELPEQIDRRRYLEMFMTRFDPEVQLKDAGLDKVAEVTHGYSFAYLKELYVSSVVQWVSTDQHRKIVEVLIEQAQSLREQMVTEISTPNIATAASRMRYPFFPGMPTGDVD